MNKMLLKFNLTAFTARAFIAVSLPPLKPNLNLLKNKCFDNNLVIHIYLRLTYHPNHKITVPKKTSDTLEGLACFESTVFLGPTIKAYLYFI